MAETNQNLNGFLLVIKPKGMTSYAVCSAIKKHFHLAKVGHCGTLDPNATGLLIVGINEATKYISYVLNQDKEYLATAALWEKRDSFDVEGKIIASIPPDKRFPVDERVLDDILYSFKGEFLQIPPIYSAIKVNGTRLYKSARKGLNIKPKARKVKVNYIQLGAVYNDRFYFTVNCSKGTYIRSLVNDIGEKLGAYAYLKDLIRMKIGRFHVEEGIYLNKLLAKETINKRDSFYKEIPLCIQGFQIVIIKSDEKVIALLNGKQVKVTGIDNSQSLLIGFNRLGKFFGIVKVIEKDTLQAHRMLSIKAFKGNMA